LLKKIKGQKPNLEVNSHQQIALLTTNNFSTSFAPVLNLRLSLPNKNIATLLAVVRNLLLAPFSLNRL
jgi:hypothetical protein